MSGRSLIAGLGNLFFGDDHFGAAVAQRLQQRELPREVEVLDVGIRGMDLAFRLLDGYATIVLVDAVKRGEAPGTLYVMEPDPDADWPGEDAADSHGMLPSRALRMARDMGAEWETLRLVGCEPARLDGDGLSAAVAARVEEAAELALREAGADAVETRNPEGPTGA